MTTATFEDNQDADALAGWAERLVHAELPTASPLSLAQRALSGLGLAALYGLAIGARQGGSLLLAHALGVPLGLLLLGVVGAPCLFVFLALFRANITGSALIGAFARGVGSAGLLLAGLAPAAALFVVSSATPQAASFAVLFGLVLGGGLALGRIVLEILRGLWAGGSISNLAAYGIVGGFGFFAVLLEARIWSAMLPVLGGAS
jgi:hypothetical protein